MKTLRLIFGDQLSSDISSLSGIDPARDVVLLIESVEECRTVPHHKQKIVLFLSAMRHFAADLRARGFLVDYVPLDHPENAGTFTLEVGRAIARHDVQRLILTEPGEWRVHEMVETWGARFGVTVEIRNDDRFFSSKARFRTWAARHTTWRMEYFYRDMRREHRVLMDGDTPAGGAWNFDPENRKRLPASVTPPQRLRFAPDAITQTVMALVADRFGDSFGTLEHFAWPVTRAEALQALDDFVATALPCFGDYQDAMKAGAPFLYHSLLAPALNIGLLSAREVCAAAEDAFRSGAAPINAVEGFIRQIMGWREYVRGVYWTLMPQYADTNALNARLPLPAFYWTGETEMRCLREAITSTQRNAYSHHIQRLMVTGNFALLAGISPHEIERWYLAVYADAIEWVEMPNTLGMAVFADGGKMATKPYAASGAYINRMSDFCGGCRYDVSAKTGPRACPFNYLYWAFLIRNKALLHTNPRLTMPYRTLAGWSTEKKEAYLKEAEAFVGQVSKS